MDESDPKPVDVWVQETCPNKECGITHTVRAKHLVLCVCGTRWYAGPASEPTP